MACIGMAYIFMVYIAMALCSHGLYICGQCGYALESYGLYTYGSRSYGAEMMPPFLASETSPGLMRTPRCVYGGVDYSVTAFSVSA